MKIHKIAQGTADWHALRAGHFTASEAPAMMGASRFMTRSELIRQKATGYAPEVGPAKQRLFDAGHAAEAAARPFAEDVLAQELFPVTCSAEIDGLPLLASLDGITMDEDTIWEHKLWSESLADQISLNRLDQHYYWQLEHQLLVTGASRVLFMATSENREAAECCWYKSDPERRAKLIAGWKQFAEDLAGYRHVEEKPAVVAAPVEGFGALTLQVEGRVLACNIDAFKAGAQAFLGRLPKAGELQSDQDFADAEAAVKACADAESRIKAAKDAAMAQAASIDEVFRSVDHVAELIRAARLVLEKSVKARKDSIRMEVMQGAQAMLNEHVKGLNERIGWFDGCPIISPAAADFAAAIKGRKTVASLRDACDTELARAKIATSEIADRIEANKKSMGEYAALFPDFPHVCTKTPEDFANLVAARVRQHREAEERRMQERIRDEENARARAALESSPVHAVTSMSPPPMPQPESGAPAATIQPSPPTVADGGARIKLGDINAAIAPLSITADGLAQLGFPHIGTEKAAKLYRAADFPGICQALISHIAAIANTEYKEAA